MDREKLRNSDYPKFIKLFNSEDPKHCFVYISTDRDSGNHEGLSKKKIDGINRRNNHNSLDLMHQLNANGLRFLEAKGHYDEDHIGEIIQLSDVHEMPVYLKGKRTLDFDQSSDVLNYMSLGKNERRFQLDDFKESGFHRNSICGMWYGSNSTHFRLEKTFERWLY